MTQPLKNRIVDKARRLGFDAVRVTVPDALGEAGARLGDFLREGRHGDMDWMATHASRRADPRALWPEVRSIIMLGMSYAPDSDPMVALTNKQRGAISVYAQGRDYHDVIKAKLKALAQVLTVEGAQSRVFVDTAPLMEKPLAQAAGIGWQGRHTNLVSRDHGSWLFLGAVLTSAELEADAPEADHCGSCRRCLDVCPTNAFPAPYQLDARRCIAYLTIEYKGHIAQEFRRPIGNRVFGCDDCLAVCPWNKFAERGHEAKLHTRTETDNPPLAELLALDDRAFRLRFAGTPIKRTGRDRFIRNCLIAAGNARDVSLVPMVLALVTDASPLVRAMAAWALHQLQDLSEMSVLADRMLTREHDPDVRREWREVAS